MPALADDFAPALAISLINLFGVSASLSTKSGRTFDAIEGEHVYDSTSSITMTVTPPTQYSKRLTPPDGIPVSSSVSYIKGNESTIPKKGDSLSINNENWTILYLDPLISGEQTAAYRLWLKR